MVKRIKNWLLICFIAAVLMVGWLVYYAIAPLKLQPSSQEVVIAPNSGL